MYIGSKVLVCSLLDRYTMQKSDWESEERIAGTSGRDEIDDRNFLKVFFLQCNFF